MTTPANPFLIGRYIDSRYFCDREAETKLLSKHIENGRDVILSAQRRMGKTGLIRHFFASDIVKDNYLTVFIDIYATNTLAEFVYLLSNAVYDTIRDSIWNQMQHFFQAISSLRVGMRIDVLSGEPTLDLRLGQIENPAETLKQVFEYLDQQARKVIVAIDEFQQIGEYPEKHTEALLRTLIQQSKNIQFIYSGSKKHIIGNMFNSSSKPFYQSALFMDVPPIPCELYNEFSMRLFKEYGRTLHPDVAPEVYKLTYGVTWYMQVWLNELFAQTPSGGECSIDMVPIALTSIIDAQRQNYLDIISRLSGRQKALLMAIARCEPVREVNSRDFIVENGLLSASSVQSALRPLDNQGLITREGNTVRLSDIFFSKWLSRY